MFLARHTEDWNQRDYDKVDGQIGHEPTEQEFIDVMVEIFYRQLFKKLKPHGLIFLNLGGSYNGSGGQGTTSIVQAGIKAKADKRYKDRDYVDVPNHVYEALRQAGYYLRSVVVWEKLNGMPFSGKGVRWEKHRVRCYEGDEKEVIDFILTHGEAVNFLSPKKEGFKKVWVDCPSCNECKSNNGFILKWGSGRPKSEYELIGILTKSEYYWDTEATRTKYAESSTPRKFRNHFSGNFGDPTGSGAAMGRGSEEFAGESGYLGAVLGDVWSLPTAQFREAHFATFPVHIPELCIKAGSSEYGCCAECGAPYARMLEQIGRVMEDVYSRTADVNNLSESSALRGNGVQVFQTVGWRATCECNTQHEWEDKFEQITCTRCGISPTDTDAENACRVPAVVLDPFNGAGTTMLVANRLGRDAVGIDLGGEDGKYMDIAANRVYRDAPLFNHVAGQMELFK